MIPIVKVRESRAMRKIREKRLTREYQLVRYGSNVHSYSHICFFLPYTAH